MSSAGRRPFTGMPLDRAELERKDPALVRKLAADPAARMVIWSEDGVAVADGALARVKLPPDARQEPILLGLQDGHGVFAGDLQALPDAVRDAVLSVGEIVPLREAGAELAHSEAGLAAYLAALLGWHRHHRFCSNCGALSEIVEAGHSRRCPRCGTVHFPRTDPVVIMAVEHDGRLLLGRRAGSPAGRYSVLAGFVSPGESAEEAVIREVREESGIVARDPTFVTSQPWPFPSSLMLAFEARADGGDPRSRDGELEDVRWVSHEEVCASIQDQNPELLLPARVSVARFLIERWAASRGD